MARNLSAVLSGNSAASTEFVIAVLSRASLSRIATLNVLIAATVRIF